MNYKKLLGLLFVNRVETKNKWWDRLSNVLIGISTVLVGVIAASGFILGTVSDWREYSYGAYSFESDYQLSPGREIECSGYDKLYPVYCGGSSIDKIDLVKRYNKVIRNNIGESPVTRLCQDSKNESLMGSEKLTTKQINCFNLDLDLRPISVTNFADVVNDNVTYERYLTNEQAGFVRAEEFKFNIGFKVKRSTDIIFFTLFKYLALAFLTTFIWFVFWQSVVYRLLLYVIYGKSK